MTDNTNNTSDGVPTAITGESPRMPDAALMHLTNIVNLFVRYRNSNRPFSPLMVNGRDTRARPAYVNIDLHSDNDDDFGMQFYFAAQWLRSQDPGIRDCFLCVDSYVDVHPIGDDPASIGGLDLDSMVRPSESPTAFEAMSLSYACLVDDDDTPQVWHGTRAYTYDEDGGMRWTTPMIEWNRIENAHLSGIIAMPSVALVEAEKPTPPWLLQAGSLRTIGLFVSR